MISKISQIFSYRCKYIKQSMCALLTRMTIVRPIVVSRPLMFYGCRHILYNYQSEMKSQFWSKGQFDDKEFNFLSAINLSLPVKRLDEVRYGHFSYDFSRCLGWSPAVNQKRVEKTNINLKNRLTPLNLKNTSLKMLLLFSRQWPPFYVPKLNIGFRDPYFLSAT